MSHPLKQQASRRLTMEAYKKAGNECASGDLQAAATDINVGTPHIDAASARIRVLNGH
jgi:hypothetical protein